MTTQTLVTRDERARLTLENLVREALQSPPPTSVVVTARDNYSGEPSLYVSVTMPSEPDIPNVAAQNRLTGDMLASLEHIDDRRFPYLFFGPRENTENVESSNNSQPGQNF